MGEGREDRTQIEDVITVPKTDHKGYTCGFVDLYLVLAYRTQDQCWQVREA